MNAKRLVVHAFSGPDEKGWLQGESGGTVILCLDQLLGHNLLDNNLAAWIEHLLDTKPIDLWLAGPPCRSVSVCRMRRWWWSEATARWWPRSLWTLQSHWKGANFGGSGYDPLAPKLEMDASCPGEESVGRSVVGAAKRPKPLETWSTWSSTKFSQVARNKDQWLIVGSGSGSKLIRGLLDMRQGSHLRSSQQYLR